MPSGATVEAHGEVLEDGSLAVKYLYIVTENPHIKRRMILFNMAVLPEPTSP